MPKAVKIGLIGCVSLIILSLGVIFLLYFVGKGMFPDDITRLSDKYGTTGDSIYYYTYGYHTGVSEKTAADPLTFEDLTVGYGRDEKYVYYGGEIIEGADPQTFELVDASYRVSKDGEHVYLYGESIKGLDIASWEYFGNYYSKDKNRAYYGDMVIEGADVETFTLEEYGDTAVDKNRTYYKGIPNQ